MVNKILKKNVNWKILGISISIPLFFSILIQISYILHEINPMFAFIINLETFTAFLLVFLSGIIAAVLLKANIKEGVLNGTLVGLIGELMIILIITLFVLASNPNFSIHQLVNWEFSIYISVNLLFQTINGCVGGVIGSIIISNSKHE